MKLLLASCVRGLTALAGRLATLANAAGTLMVLALVLVVNYDVVARGAFNAPFRGAIEVVQFSMVLIVFLQLPDVVRVNRLTRSDGFLVFFSQKHPRIAALLRHTIDGVSCLFMLLIAIAIWPEFIAMWKSQDYFGIPGVFTAPWWPIKLVVFLSAALCTLIFFLKAISPVATPELIRLPEHEERP
jgi:TRAP-type C4-dicarboxylate transport system permease small subunit